MASPFLTQFLFLCQTIYLQLKFLVRPSTVLFYAVCYFSSFLFFRLLSKFFLEDGTVVSWGNNTYGQLGHDFNNILRVENIGYCTDIACGGANSYFLSYQQVFSCGNGEMGKLGHGSNMRTLRRPVRIEGLINYTVRNIYARVNNYAVVTGYSPSTLPLLS